MIFLPNNIFISIEIKICCTVQKTFYNTSATSFDIRKNRIIDNISEITDFYHLKVKIQSTSKQNNILFCESLRKRTTNYQFQFEIIFVLDLNKNEQKTIDMSHMKSNAKDYFITGKPVMK